MCVLVAPPLHREAGEGGILKLGLVYERGMTVSTIEQRITERERERERESWRVKGEEKNGRKRERSRKKRKQRERERVQLSEKDWKKMRVSE